MTRYLQAQLFQVSPLDSSVLAAASVVLAAAAVFAATIPAQRAASLDPTAALRHE
jgi:ABC-type lipoprotein release transport system permease subunit